MPNIRSPRTALRVLKSEQVRSAPRSPFGVGRSVDGQKALIHTEEDRSNMVRSGRRSNNKSHDSSAQDPSGEEGAGERRVKRPAPSSAFDGASIDQSPPPQPDACVTTAASAAAAARDGGDPEEDSAAQTKANVEVADGEPLDPPTKKPRRSRTTNWAPISADEILDASWARRPNKTVQRDGKAADPRLRTSHEALRAATERRMVAAAELEAAREAFEAAQERYRTAQERDAEALVEEQRAADAVEEVELSLPGKWNDMYRRLLQFKEERGHLRVGEEQGDDPELRKLATWIVHQKCTYSHLLNGRHKTNKPFRIAALERLGVFVGKWEERYEQLVAYKEEHGDCNVPTRKSKDHKKLGAWVGFQRTEYRKLQQGKKPCTMNQERIDKLERIGFTWGFFSRKESGADGVGDGSSGNDADNSYAV